MHQLALDWSRSPPAESGVADRAPIEIALPAPPPSARMRELKDLYGVDPQRGGARSVALPKALDHAWSIGLILGPSGSGKSSAARAVFGEFASAPPWSADKPLIDDFPASLTVAEIGALLNAVGLSSVPVWLRPYAALSTGERFRADLARAFASRRHDPIVVDEFTSVVDRTTARAVSHAAAKFIRRRGWRLVAISCHDDIVDWLDPDWVYTPLDDRVTRRSLRGRPPLILDVYPVAASAWRRFHPHHYLSGGLHRAARCFCADIAGETVAFSAWLWTPHPIAPGFREHRTVTLPAWQGFGVGSRLADHLAGCFAALGKPVRSLSAHPSVLAHRRRSPLWKVVTVGHARPHGASGTTGMAATSSAARVTAAFRYVGPQRPEEARRLGITARRA